MKIEKCRWWVAHSDAKSSCRSQKYPGASWRGPSSADVGRIAKAGEAILIPCSQWLVHDFGGVRFAFLTLPKPQHFQIMHLSNIQISMLANIRRLSQNTDFLFCCSRYHKYPSIQNIDLHCQIFQYWTLPCQIIDLDCQIFQYWTVIAKYSNIEPGQNNDLDCQILKYWTWPPHGGLPKAQCVGESQALSACQTCRTW